MVQFLVEARYTQSCSQTLVVESIKESLILLEYWPALCAIQKGRNYTGSVKHGLRSQGDMVVVKDTPQGSEGTGGAGKTSINLQPNPGVW